MHNAMSSLDDRFAVPNNFRSMGQALEAGARGLMLDIVSTRSGARFCHAECALGALELEAGDVAITTAVAIAILLLLLPLLYYYCCCHCHLLLVSGFWC